MRIDIKSQRKRTERLETNPYIHGHLISTRVSGQFNEEKIVFSNGAGTTGFLYANERS